MLIEPRRAAPGALRRWSFQALGLIVRGAGVWLGLIVLLCLAIFAGQRLPLVSGLLALMAFFGSVLIAARLDESDEPTISDILAAVRGHGQTLLAFSAVITAAGALVWILVLARPEVPWWNVVYTERNVVEVLSAEWFLAARERLTLHAARLCFVHPVSGDMMEFVAPRPF